MKMLANSKGVLKGCCPFDPRCTAGSLASTRISHPEKVRRVVKRRERQEWKREIRILG